MEDIKLVVLDMAGTTVEDKNFVTRALVNALQKFGIRVTEQEVNPLMGIPKPVAIRKLLSSNSRESLKISDSWVNEIHQRFVLEMVHFYASSQEVKEKKGVRELFLALKERNIKIVIDTGFDRKIAQTIIHRLGWEKEQLIDYSVTSDEVVNGRPFPDMIFKAMELAGVQRVEQVAKVGDTASDIRQGHNAGCKIVVGITSGAFTEEDLRTENPTHLIEELPQLLPIIQPLQVT